MCWSAVRQNGKRVDAKTVFDLSPGLVQAKRLHSCEMLGHLVRSAAAEFDFGSSLLELELLFQAVADRPPARLCVLSR